MLHDQSSDRRTGGKPDMRIRNVTRRRWACIDCSVVDDLAPETLAAAVIVLTWIERDEDTEPEQLAARLGCSEEHAADLMAELHDNGIIFWGEGPHRSAWNYPPLDDVEPPSAPLPPIHLRSTRRGPDWRGTWPAPAATEIPRKGANIAYVLWADDERPRYVGSTDNLAGRLGAHSRNGRQFCRWDAYLCDDRDGAYAFEEHLNRKLRPLDNPGSDSLARSAYARAVSA